MLHPVPPPEPPSILQHSSRDDASPAVVQVEPVSSTREASVVAAEVKTLSPPSASLSRLVSPTLATPNPPEILVSAPKFSQSVPVLSQSAKTANLLGSPIGIGYPIQSLEPHPSHSIPASQTKPDTNKHSPQSWPVLPDVETGTKTRSRVETRAKAQSKAKVIRTPPSSGKVIPSVKPKSTDMKASGNGSDLVAKDTQTADSPGKRQVVSPSPTKDMERVDLPSKKQGVAPQKAMRMPESLENIQAVNSQITAVKDRQRVDVLSGTQGVTLQKNTRTSESPENIQAVDSRVAAAGPGIDISKRHLLEALNLRVPRRANPIDMDFLSRFADAAEFQEESEVLKEFDFRAPDEIPTFPVPEVPLPEGLIPEGLPDLDRLPGNQSSQQTPERAAPVSPGDVAEIVSDRQQYDEERQVVTAEGNVLLRVRGQVIDADRMQINLPNQTVVAEGNVAWTRDGRVTRGDRFEYNLVQETGTMFEASGDLNIADSGPGAPSLDLNDPSGGDVPDRPLSDRITSQEPQTNISSRPGFMFGFGSGRTLIGGNLSNSGNAQGGGVSHVRYLADRVDFTPEESLATNLRMTNDPFSPPELEFRSKQARFKRLSPLVDEIVTSSPRLVFDDGFSLPTVRRRVLFDRRDRPPGLFNVGFDDGDRGGLFIERTFQIISADRVQFTVTPQFFVQRSIFGRRGPLPDSPREDRGFFNPANYGFRSRLTADLGAGFGLEGRASFTSLDPEQIPERTRAKVRLRRALGNHRMSVEYNYRDRLFNGSLGFQDVRSSLGIVIESPTYRLGKSGIILNYQGSIQNVNSDTDRPELLASTRDNNRVNLTRYQASASISRGFTLWQGKALPATPTEGMKYTPAPLTPNIGLGFALTGVYGIYSNGERQQTLRGRVGLGAQFGNFSRPFLDYTALNISYSQRAQIGESPFLFDRDVDRQTIDLGFTQQLYGPFRFTFRTSFNSDTDERISTDYILEYSRRTYNISFRFNPVLEIGSLSLQISDFDWDGNAAPYLGYPGVRFVDTGVVVPED